jgi:hypothetical protein
MKKITEIQKSALLSLLMIIGLILHNPIGLICCFIGGYNFGKMIRLIQK